MSIVDGTTADFVKDNSFTVNESSRPMGPVAYPWGFPLLLAPAYWTFGVELVAFKAVVLACYILFLMTLWIGFKGLLTPRERLVLVGVFAFNPAMLRFADNVLSDIPFLFVSTLTVVMLARVFPRRLAGDNEDRYVLRVILGLVIGAAFLLRTNGLLLLAVYTWMAAYAIWRDINQRATLRGTASNVVKHGAVLVSFLGLVGAVLLLLPDGQGSHVGHVSDLKAWVLRSNVVYYSWLVSDFFDVVPEIPFIGTSIYGFSLALASIGLWRHWRYELPMVLYGVATLALFVVWPYQQGLRFIFPIIPIYVYFFILGVRTASSSSLIGARILRPALPVLVSTFAIAASAAAVQNVSLGRPVPRGPYLLTASEMFDFIRTNVRPDEVVVFWKPRAMRLYTGRRSLNYDRVEDFKYGDYLVIYKTAKAPQRGTASLDSYGKPGNERSPSLVFENSDFRVFQLRRRATPASGL